jgi:hypothetical protein
MKTNLLRTSLLAVVAAAAIYGQSSQSLQATVPFDFIVGSRTLRAGQYSLDQGSVSGMTIIRDVDHNGVAIVIGSALESLAAQEDGKLVFHRYGDTYFLAEVWGAGHYGRQIRKTSREREMAAQRLLPDTTILVARR